MFIFKTSKNFEGNGFLDFNCSEKLVLINKASSDSSTVELYNKDLQQIDEIVINPAKTIRVIEFSDDYLAFSENNELFKVYKINPALNLNDANTYDLLAVVSNGFIITSYPDNDNKGFIGLLKNKEIAWKQMLVYMPFFIANTNICFGFPHFDENWVVKKDEFSCISLTNGKLLWTKSVSNLGKYSVGKSKATKNGEVDSFLGVNRQLVWACLNNGSLIGLNTETGAVAHQVGAPNTYPEELYMLEETRNQNFFYNHKSIFDDRNGKIIRLWHTGYSGADFDWCFEIDLNTDKLEVLITKVENATGIPFIIGDGPAWSFDDEFVYLCNYRDYKIALFNRKTKKIEWVHQIEVDPTRKSHIVKMEVQGNHWYIMDYSKTLFVFEREM
jgi:hypothetical protein